MKNENFQFKSKKYEKYIRLSTTWQFEFFCRLNVFQKKYTCHFSSILDLCLYQILCKTVAIKPSKCL